jgi:hypothetical protein
MAEISTANIFTTNFFPWRQLRARRVVAYLFLHKPMLLILPQTIQRAPPQP